MEEERKNALEMEEEAQEALKARTEEESRRAVSIDAPTASLCFDSFFINYSACYTL
jgi:hypothetical protein